MSAVNAQGEPLGEFASLSPGELESLATEAAETISRLHGEASALVNALTCLVIRAGGTVEIPASELDGLGHRFAMVQDPATKAVVMRAIRKDGVALALTAAQELDNRRAAEVALPKGRLVKPPTGLILP